jgi:hypothetical protein
LNKASPLKIGKSLAMFIFYVSNEEEKTNIMKAILRKYPVEIVNRLDQLGVKRGDLLEVVDRMVSARNGCTENHPPGSAGWMSWAEGTCRLREIFLRLGWEKNEEFCISSVWDKKTIRIAVSNTDYGTGLEAYQPQNRSRKGSGTNQAVALNQAVFTDILENALNVIQLPQTPGGSVYWYLCVYAEGDVVRAELSCPSSCENGYFTAFHERILLIAGDDNEDVKVRRSAPDDDLEFEINVTRKQG